MSTSIHIPVLLNEALDFLEIKENDTVWISLWALVVMVKKLLKN